MKRYIDQLIADISEAIENVPRPYADSEGHDIWDYVSEEDERRSSIHRTLEEWTGISRDALPPEELLSDEDLERVYAAMNKMLHAYNMSIVFILCVPIRTQYRVLRAYYDQELPMLYWNMGFFEVCPVKSAYDQCLLGEFCHCRFFDEMRANQIEEDLTPEEERERMLDIEVRHIQRKYGSDWMKYYPYHLDPDYDDEDGNPYDYGFGSLRDDEDDDDDWWKKPLR